MKKVIDVSGNAKEESKPVEFTHCFGLDGGWHLTTQKPDSHFFEKIIYLGKCSIDGDMFACYSTNGAITIFKGHLNSGTY
jgi:hypothetical protein